MNSAKQEPSTEERYAIGIQQTSLMELRASRTKVWEANKEFDIK